jgi:hypothetical protein
MGDSHVLSPNTARRPSTMVLSEATTAPALASTDRLANSLTSFMRISSLGLLSWTVVVLSLSLYSSEAREEERREERGERALCVRHKSYLTPSSSVVRLPRMKHTLTSISWWE